MNKLVVICLLACILAHPWADHGSDADDALEIGWRAIISGRAPWAERTHLGNALTPTYGGLLIAAPVALVPAEWLALIAAGLLYHISGGGLAWALVLLVASKSLVQGTDYIYASSVLCWALWWAQRRHQGRSTGHACR
jgi:VIT1/CCC1 family predicted Fe2+/Mn2+ transporter